MSDEMMKDAEYLFHTEERPPTELEKLQNQVTSDKMAYKTLYEEVRADFNRLKEETKKIKPVLKIDDPESEKWIRSILSKHDHTVRTQQTTIEEKMLQLRHIEGEIQHKVSFYQISLKEVNTKYDTILKHLERIQTPSKPSFLDKVKAFFK